MINLRGVEVHKGYLEGPAQADLVQDLRALVAVAPFYTPVTAGGRPMSVQITAAGRFGWMSDRKGYRYEPVHPTGVDWPEVPDAVLAIWRDLAAGHPDPECCLINHYREGTRMGLHQDRDEASFDHPVVSISLGDSALFRVGNVTRGGKTESIWLDSGDVCVMGGPARLAYHGIDRIRFGSSTLLRQGGRINLTLRVVT